MNQKYEEHNQRVLDYWPQGNFPGVVVPPARFDEWEKQGWEFTKWLIVSLPLRVIPD